MAILVALRTSMTKRVVDGSGWIMTYDTENRMTQAQSTTATVTFVYDGDGRRVKGTAGGVTTAYIGNYYEWTGSTGTMVRYYYAGATRVAMRVGSSTLYYLLSDQLGSTTITANSSGVEYGELRYKGWGEQRFTSGTTPSVRHFTGQILESSLGLYFYGARWYDDALGRFIQPDSIVPLAIQGVQAWDRYAFTNNNPVRFNDPTGHWIESFLDIASIAYDIYDISQNGLNWENGISLAADIGGLILPGVTGGGLAVRALNHADEAIDVARAVDNAGDVLQGANQIDNAIDTANVADAITPSGGVYSLRNPDGKVVRVGLTNDFSRRAGEYSRDPNYFDLQFKPEHYTDDYATQRGLEQMMYDNHNPPLNKNLPIALRNSNRQSYLDAANSYLGKR